MDYRQRVDGEERHSCMPTKGLPDADKEMSAISAEDLMPMPMLTVS